MKTGLAGYKEKRKRLWGREFTFNSGQNNFFQSFRSRLGLHTKKYKAWSFCVGDLYISGMKTDTGEKDPRNEVVGGLINGGAYIRGGGSVISGIKKNVSKRTSHTSVDRNTVIQQRDQGGLFPGGAYNRGGGGGGA